MRSKTSQAGILLSLVLVLLLSAGCLSSVKEIQQGFSDKLVQMLSEDYDLVIPESAVLRNSAFQQYISAYADMASRHCGSGFQKEGWLAGSDRGRR